ncbi:MAG: SLBB domain-containing protein [Bacteroidales bacterium]|nr:SLBB domain-containing protein [Bacteroidales bacterium]
MKQFYTLLLLTLFVIPVFGQTLDDIFERKDTIYTANNKLRVPIEPGKSDTLKTGAEGGKITEMTIPVTTPQEAAAEAAQRVIKDAAAKSGGIRIYGHSVFTDQTLDVFRKTDGSQAPETYILGAGDEIRITIFGASQTDLQLRINNEGYIQPEGMSKIFLQGMSIAQARELLVNRLSTFFTFRADQLSLTVATARTVLVNIFGETRITGGFTVSALNSALNAISAAGGITDIGSVRNIQLIRGKQKKTIDLYAFMSNPSYQFGLDIQQNDILFVPVAENIVSIEGAVKRPMYYEMLPGESLETLIRYAGGIRVNTYPDFVQIERYQGDEIRLQEYNLAEVLSGKLKVPLQNGDIVRVRSIGKPIEQFAEVVGSVYYPGRYDLVQSPTLGSLLGKAQPTKEARKDLVIVERYRPDETVELLTLDWQSMKAGGKDFNLQPRDRVTIPLLATYRDLGAISVSGDVRDPFQKSLALGDRITVKQALEIAGGLKNTAYPVAYIFRKNQLNPSEVTYIRVDLPKADETLLQPGDRLNVYDNTLFTNVGEVRVNGAVKKAGGLTYDPLLQVADLITTAGGVTVGAVLDRVEVFRNILSPDEPARIERITLSLDSAYRVTNPVGFKLQPYDQIVVRQTPGFTTGRTVEISGEVTSPGIYVLGSRQVCLSEIIKMAGGLLDGADATGSRLFRTKNSTGSIAMDVRKAVRRSGNIRFDPVVMEGDVININRMENTVSIRSQATGLEQTNGPDNAVTLVYQGKKSARWYILHYAGGFGPKADKNSVTVVLKNGQMKGTGRTIFGIRKYPKVTTGAMIMVGKK